MYIFRIFYIFCIFIYTVYLVSPPHRSLVSLSVLLCPLFPCLVAFSDSTLVVLVFLIQLRIDCLVSDIKFGGSLSVLFASWKKVLIKFGRFLFLKKEKFSEFSVINPTLYYHNIILIKIKIIDIKIVLSQSQSLYFYFYLCSFVIHFPIFSSFFLFLSHSPLFFSFS